MKSRTVLGYVALCLQDVPEGYSEYRKGNYFSVEGPQVDPEDATILRNHEGKVIPGFCKIPVFMDLCSLSAASLALLSD
jgi:hypothetical protein